MVIDSFILLCYFIWFSSDKVSLHWSVNHCVAQPGNSPAVAFQVLGLRACATMPSFVCL